MKEIRGQEAVRYAEEQGLFFSADEDYMLRAESTLLRRPATLDDIDALFEERLGTDYDRTNLFPGEDSFNLLVERYGYEWICVALEGKHPAEEERALLGMFRSLLKEEDPSNGGDVLDLATVYGPALRDTGFPGWATTNLLFHAALRLVGNGLLESVMDSRSPSENPTTSYGNRLFFVPPDAEIRFSEVLCGGCQDRASHLSLSLHSECAEQLRSALEKVTVSTNPIGSGLTSL
jgi:hypothetical protein